MMYFSQTLGAAFTPSTEDAHIDLVLCALLDGGMTDR